MEVIEMKEPRETTERDEEEDEDEEDEDEEDGDEERDEEAEEELEDVEGLLLARFFDRLAGGLAARTNSTPSTVNRYSLPMPSL
jgi:hypothetical protein